MTDDPKTEENTPLRSPTEMAGTTEGAIAAEFAARDVEEALETEAEGSAAEEDTLPLDGE